MLPDDYIEKCSETSIIAKYWCQLFESFFGTDVKNFLQWGETMSVACREEKMKVKLDLRFTVNNVESSISEFASQGTTTEGKFFNDKLKSALVTKSI
ncbi:hypothetical protein BDC45DRAFT_597530 [Circinella umbellata]|nr:hypothetical protein BDC45DRAFT_597530 [Circinella umbellata]